MKLISRRKLNHVTYTLIHILVAMVAQIGVCLKLLEALVAFQNEQQQCGCADKANLFVECGKRQQIINEVKLVPEGIT